ncbi:TPA: hypothetical protein ACH3X1_000366 [Trebouxia sp. C0004]
MGDIWSCWTTASDNSVLLTEASKNALTIIELSEQATQLQAALKVQTKEAAAVAQLAKGHQQQMDLNMADLGSQLESERCRCAKAGVDHKAAQADLAEHLVHASATAQQLKSQYAELASQVVHAELEAAKLQISTLKAQLVMSHEAADSARAASDSQAQQMRTSADTELSKIAQLRQRFVTSSACWPTLKLMPEVNRLEQQLAESQNAAAQQEEELKKLHQTKLKSQLQSVKSEASLSFLQAMKDAVTVKDFTEQATHLQAALTAANNKAGAAAAAAAQHARAHQQQLDDLLAHHTASAENTKVVLAELEVAKLQISPPKAQLFMSHEAADSARTDSDSLAQQVKKSADTELLKVVRMVDTGETELGHLPGLLANTQAHAKSEAANLQLLEKSQFNAASAQQDVNRHEQQLTGSQTAAAQQQEELKKLPKAELKSEAARGQRMWEDLFGHAAQPRTDLQVANAKSEAEAQDAAHHASELHQQMVALSDSTQDLQDQLHRQGWRALEAQATAERETSQLQAQSAAAQASDESAQQDVKRLEHQLAGSQAAAAPKEQELVAQVALTQEQASKLRGQLETALVDINSLPRVVRSAWFERNRIKAILEATCDDRDHPHTHMVTKVEAIQKLIDALASSCKCARSELRDAQVDQNRTNCQLEAALVEKDESQGQLEKVTKKYKHLKGQYDRALADLSNQQEQHTDALLDAEQPSTELAESQIIQCSPTQQANQDATGPWKDAHHIQQQQIPNSHTHTGQEQPSGPSCPLPRNPQLS